MTTSRPLSIVHALEKHHFRGGAIHQMFQAATGQAAAGHRVTVVSKPGGELGDRCRAAGLDFVALPFRNELDAVSAVRFARLLREKVVDVVHVHKGTAHAVALMATYLTPIPCLVVNRGVSFPLDLWMRGKYRSKRVHRIVTVCEDIRRVVIESGRVDPDKVKVVYAGTDLTKFDPQRVDPDPVRRELGIPAERRVICQIGAREWRGWRDLVDAMGIVVREHPEAHLLLVACRDEAQIAEVRELARERGFEGNVTALGYRSDPERIAAAQDIAVDLSYAGLGVTGTLREAMAMGKPVVASHAGGNAELVLDGLTGTLVPPRDPQATAAAILALLRDPAQGTRFGTAGRRRVEEGFSATARLARLEALYREVLEEGLAAKG